MQSECPEYRSIYNKSLDLAEFIFKMSSHAPLDFAQDGCYSSRYFSGSLFMFHLHLNSLIGGRAGAGNWAGEAAEGHQNR